MIRTPAADIPVYGRSASGVIVMRLEEGASFARFAAFDPETEAEDKISEETENTEEIAETTVEAELSVGEE